MPGLLAVGEGLGALLAADAAVVVHGRAVRRGRGGQIGIAYHLLVENMLSGGVQDLALLCAADGAGVDHGTGGGVGGLDGDFTGVPLVGAVAVGNVRVAAGIGVPVVVFVIAPIRAEGVPRLLPIGEGFGALLAAEAAIVVHGRAVRRGRGGQVGIAYHLLVKDVLGGGVQGLALLHAADGAGVDHGTRGGVGGLDGDFTGVPLVGAVAVGNVRVAAGVGVPVVIFVIAPIRAEGVPGLLPIGEGFGALLAAEAAVVIHSRAVRRGGGGQIGIAYHLLVEDVGVLRHRGLGRNEGIGNGPGEAGSQGAGVLALGIAGGIDANQAGAGASHQPAEALHGGQLRGDPGGNLLAHPGVVHQGGHAELAAGGAQDSPGIHTAAGAQGGADRAQEDVIAIVAGYRHLHHGDAAPLGIIAEVHRAAYRGIHRLLAGDVDIQPGAASRGVGMVGMGAAGIGAVIQGAGVLAPAAGDVGDVAVKFLGQGEYPSIHLAVHHRLPLLGAQGSVGLLCVGIHPGEESNSQHCTQKQGYYFLKY